MATEKQKLAVEKMVENGGIVSTAMLEAGYSPATAKTPQKLTESDGFLELCNKAGLTDDLILESLTEDIKQKPQKRVEELRLAAKIKKMLTDRVEYQGSISVNFDEAFTDYGSTPSPESGS
jgi:hypothetical protein